LVELIEICVVIIGVWFKNSVLHVVVLTLWNPKESQEAFYIKFTKLFQ